MLIILEAKRKTPYDLCVEVNCDMNNYTCQCSTNKLESNKGQGDNLIPNIHYKL